MIAPFWLDFPASNHALKNSKLKKKTASNHAFENSKLKKL